MSGHSHARTVLHRKRSEGEKRGKMFSKLARLISVAAKDGSDPEMNAKLKQAIEEAKRYNMPKDNIERAVKKGSGELEGERFEEVNIEGFGPGGIALIIKGITDNKNRTLSELKQILQKHNGKLADEGSVRWLFEQKGAIIINPQSLSRQLIKGPSQTPAKENKLGVTETTGQEKEELELKTIEAGAENLMWRKSDDNEEFLEVTTKTDGLEKVKKTLEEQGINIESSSLGWIAREEIEVSEKDTKNCLKLFEELDENEAVQEVYSNLKV